ncbi:hypothetical protein HRG_014928 [Hirsutella rhossiliensis]
MEEEGERVTSDRHTAKTIGTYPEYVVQFMVGLTATKSGPSEYNNRLHWCWNNVTTIFPTLDEKLLVIAAVEGLKEARPEWYNAWELDAERGTHPSKEETSQFLHKQGFMEKNPHRKPPTALSDEIPQNQPLVERDDVGRGTGLSLSRGVEPSPRLGQLWLSQSERQKPLRLVPAPTAWAHNHHLALLPLFSLSGLLVCTEVSNNAVVLGCVHVLSAPGQLSRLPREATAVRTEEARRRSSKGSVPTSISAGNGRDSDGMSCKGQKPEEMANHHEQSLGSG